MRHHVNKLPPGWYVEGLHLHSADGHSRCVNFSGKLQHERVSLTLKNYGHADYAALWEADAAQLLEVLKSISGLASRDTGDTCRDIKRRADHAIAFAA